MAKHGAKNKWFLDTGYSNHMCGEEEMFTQLDESFTSSMKFGNDTMVPVMGKGKIFITLKDGSHDAILNAVDSTHESENSSIGSPAMSSELEQQQGRSMPSPDQLTQSSVMELRSPAPETATPAETQSKLTLPLLSPELAAS
ncbi:hypothetical protein LWI29_034729 [Acer saccharum]|uniref:Retrovirus-related Pol polyprotein from transposon TNT 1-94-like beta-barrel domain-containing protein n=1 Tax=Acer saccharum TaxID=4024 RepID=A0AA39SGC6_ACESA|nr:hypothetical protein LWI29_034729 [Acer saccharum]